MIDKMKKWSDLPAVNESTGVIDGKTGSYVDLVVTTAGQSSLVD
jgi:hypothetical protein